MWFIFGCFESAYTMPKNELQAKQQQKKFFCHFLVNDNFIDKRKNDSTQIVWHTFYMLTEVETSSFEFSLFFFIFFAKKNSFKKIVSTSQFGGQIKSFF